MFQRKKGVITRSSVSGSIPIELKERLIKLIQKEKSSYSEAITEAVSMLLESRSNK